MYCKHFNLSNDKYFFDFFWYSSLYWLGLSLIFSPVSTSIKLQAVSLKSKLILEDAIGSSVKYFSYPYGDYSEKNHIFGLSAGYDFLFTSNHGIAKKNSKILPRNNIHSGLDRKKILKIMKYTLSCTINKIKIGIPKDTKM